MRPLSKKYSEKLAEVIPGGVDSPFRSFKEVGGHEIFFSRAQGAKLYDVDGFEYIDFLGAWGPAILGHAPDEIISACREVLALGPVFGAPHVLELEMANLLIAAIPNIEKVRFVNSGTEAVMTAIRLARRVKDKEMIIMFEGGYHGHSDSTLASNGHRASGGITHGTASDTLLARFNDQESLASCLKAHAGKVAAVLLEPVAGSMGVIPPRAGFLEALRQLCDEHDCLLIFDEVLTGFRIAFGGAQNFYNVRADLICLGKGLGGGMPIGAVGGAAQIMDHLQPIGDVYQAGTFSGNPVTMAGGIAMLKLLANVRIYETLELRTGQLFQGLNEIIGKYSLPVQLQRVGSMFGILFSAQPVQNYQDSLSINTDHFARFFNYLLEHGVYMPPSAVDAACISAAHTVQDIEDVIMIANAALRSIFLE